MSWVMKAGKQEKADSPGTGLGEHSLPSQPLETMEKSNLHTQNQDSYCWWHVGKKNYCLLSPVLQLYLLGSNGGSFISKSLQRP